MPHSERRKKSVLESKPKRPPRPSATISLSCSDEVGYKEKSMTNEYDAWADALIEEKIINDERAAQTYGEGVEIEADESYARLDIDNQVS
jgi:hypothetical protein